LAIKGTDRDYSNLDSEKKVLRRIITAVMIVVSLGIGVFLRKLLNSYTEFTNQILVLLLLNIFLLLIFLIPTIIFSKMEADCSYDYISKIRDGEKQISRSSDLSLAIDAPFGDETHEG
jgi:hypothetical protein